MEIAGYDIPDQYLIAGAGVLVVGGILLSKRNTSTEEIATLRPAEGLSWQDIIGQSDEGKLIGPGGPSGTPGDTGPPGPPGPGTQPECTDNSDCSGNKRCRNGKCVRTRPNDPEPEPECRNDNQCKNNEECKRGECVKKDNRDGNRDHNRPDMPRNRDGKDFSDPRLDRPRDRKQRDEASNRIDRDRDRNRNEVSFRERFERRIDKRVRVNPRTGAIRHPDRDSRRSDRDGTANANASGGTVRLGNIDKGTHLNINVSGGREIVRSRGRAGYGIAGIQTDGYGRLDGRGGTADGFVRTNISPGATTGSFTPGPQPLTGQKDGLVIRQNETLKGLAKRAYGSDRFWPRIVTLNNDVILPEGEIQAGTKIRI